MQLLPFVVEIDAWGWVFDSARVGEEHPLDLCVKTIWNRIRYASGPKGYGTGQKGYRCFDPISQKLYVSRHVTFLEHIPFYSIPAKSHDVTKSDIQNIDPFASNIDVPTSDVSVSSVDPNMPAPDTSVAHDVPVHEPSTSSGTNVDSPPPPRKSTHACKSTQLPDFAYSAYSASFIADIHHLSEPESYREVVSDPLWQNSMAEELTALHRTHTWDLVPLPPGKHKARLVAKGYSQTYGMDYEETFVPVAKMTIVRTLIAGASVRQWKICQMDVKNVFLNGDLHEEVYMTPPPGIAHQPGEVCRFRKALYGLKQAPRAWFEKFSTVITSLGFLPSNHDSAL
ncbi:hypothetical protein L1987_47666 [Smallanthus sonchifolius]|uniref:Uncharacterized protein n=1 Tax=Smallanthus sonchifolius TaxID=185202 RepID=A0ACB9G352_9ASTR|nr:hypothetical protein L1987_47666 [Smallanthus sonchifolius]